VHYLDKRIHSYLPSIQPGWVKTMAHSVYDYRDNIPFGSFKSVDEFNWYNGNKPRFRHPSGLYSCGHTTMDLDKARVTDKVLFQRDRDKTFLLVDSGGFQVGKGVWPLDRVDEYVTKVLRWQEAIADLAVILEVPAWTEVNGKRINFQKALDLTNRNLKLYAKQATGKVKFLIPLHGNGFEQGKEWFEKTRWFADEGHAVGWCFSDKFSLNYYEAMRMLIYMIEQEHYPRYLHFLGQGYAQVAIVADIMRRTVPRCYPKQIRDSVSERENVLTVTTDASSEFQTVGRYANIYLRNVPATGKALTNSPFTIKSERFESKDRNRFPADRTYPDVDGPILGRIEKGVVFGDIITPANSKTKSEFNLDEVSLAILIAHCIWVKLDTYERMSKLESALRRIDYGERSADTAEFAKHMKNLLHMSTNKGDISDLGEDLVACTVGLWRTFKEGKTIAERYASLEEFRQGADKLFGKSLATE
jgi:hypothetical protein